MSFNFILTSVGFCLWTDIAKGKTQIIRYQGTDADGSSRHSCDGIGLSIQRFNLIGYVLAYEVANGRIR